MCRSDGSRLVAAHRSRQRRSIARTVVSVRPNRRATCRAAALSHACPTASSKRLLNGALLGSSGTFSTLTPQSGAFHPVHLNVHGGLELAPGKVPHRTFPAVVGLTELAPAAGTLQFAVPPLPPHPEFKALVLLVDLLPVHAVTGPLQDSCEFVVRGQSLNLTQIPILRMPVNSAVLRILAHSQKINLHG